MPSVSVTRNQLLQLASQDSVSLTTPLGNTLLEIQGDLEVPTHWEDGDESGLYTAVPQGDEVTRMVRFGLLDIDTASGKAVLYVGKKQRLLGAIVKLEVPLGMLHFDHTDHSVQLQDIITHKIIFKDRPLPIM